MLSPITGVYDIARDRVWTGATAAVTGEHWLTVAAVAVAALPLWLAAGALSRGLPRAGSLH
jgi:hypothetical protein